MDDIVDAVASGNGNSNALVERTTNEGGIVIHAESGSTVIAGDVHSLLIESRPGGTLQINRERLAQSELGISDGEASCECKKRPAVDAVREQYIELCELHEIHYVDDDVIKTKMFPLNDFAVKLKMVSYRQVDESFRGEMDRYLKDLNEVTSYDINIENLIDGNTRVTFLRGIAGIGKSVLAKQIAFGWAKGSMYENFEVCLFFECRELNDYKLNEGEGYNSKELLRNFLKMKLCGLNVKDEKNMLIVVDGIDELFDIKEKNSLIFQFLDKSKSYGKSQIIMTGRPHIESVLDNPRINIGGYKASEIMGLAEEEIQKHIMKFSKCVGGKRSIEWCAFISQTINASANIRAAFCVPQFLNAICCVSVLTGGQEIRDETELYSWIFYLLLKQHVFEREEMGDENFIYNVFTKYRHSVLLLGKISYQLYIDNRIIFKRDEFKPIFDKIHREASNIEKGFFDGLFVNIPDNFSKKLQFEHLSLMEYLSAIHICTFENPADIIKTLLNNNSYEVIRYACGLYGGAFQDGIVKELYKCVIEAGKDERKSVNYESEMKDHAMLFLRIVVKVFLNSKSNNKRVHFFQAIKCVLQFLCHQFERKEFVNSVLGDLVSFGSMHDGVDFTTQRLLIRFFSTIKSIGIDDESIKSAFGNNDMDMSNLCGIEALTIMKYFGNCGLCSLSNITIDEHGMKIFADNLIYCNWIGFIDCAFEDRFFDTNHSGCDSKFDFLSLVRCKIGQMSFKTFSQCAVLSKFVHFCGPMDISRELWKILWTNIDETQTRGLKLERMLITEYTFDESSWEGAIKLIVKLKELDVQKIHIKKDWWKKLADEVNARKNDGTLKLKRLEITKPSNMKKDIQRSLEKSGVRVSLKEPDLSSLPSTSRLKPSATEWTCNESQAQDISSAQYAGHLDTAFNQSQEDELTIPEKMMKTDK